MGAGSKIFDSGQFFCCSGRVFHLWFWFGKFPLEISKLSIFSPSGKKNITGYGQKAPRSKAGRSVSYLLGSKYARVGSLDLKHYEFGEKGDLMNRDLIDGLS